VRAASATLVGLGVASAAVWLAFRTDVALYLAGQVDAQLRHGVAEWLGAAARSLFGAGAVQALGGSSSAALAVGAGVVGVAGMAAVLGLRAFASASRRARE
jgi:hypothetical protein